MELIIFPKTYAQFATILAKPNAVLIVHGKFDAKDRDGNLSDQLKMIVNEVELVSEEDLANFDSTQTPKKSQPKTSRTKSPNFKSPNSNFPKQIVHDGPGSKLKLSKNSTAVLEKEDQASTQQEPPQTLYIKITKSDYEQDLLKLKSLAEENPGKSPLVLVFGEKPNQRALKLPFKLNLTPQARTELNLIFHPENLSFH
jgi:DNA polymerase III alpha subunit